MTKINRLGNLFDEKTWKTDSFLKPPSLYQVNAYSVSLGEINGFDNDYYQLDVNPNTEYQVFLTSDTENHGWSSYSENWALEFDVFDHNDNLVGSSSPINSTSGYDDAYSFTTPAGIPWGADYYVDVHGFGGGDYALTVNFFDTIVHEYFSVLLTII